MIPRRYVIAVLGIGPGNCPGRRPTAEPLRRRKSRAAEPAANVSTNESSAREAESEGEGEVEGEEGRGGAEEAQEEAEITEKRLEALAQARANGDFGQKIAATTAPATGWVGSEALSSNFDDWEPAVATDPKARPTSTSSPRATRRGLRRALPNSLDPAHDLQGRRHDLDLPGADLRVRPLEGPVRPDHRGRARHRRGLLGLPQLGSPQRVSTVFTKSTDHGKTWTEPVHVYGQVSWTDKPEITSSASGKDVYVSWNGPQGGDLYVGISHDFGETWTQQKLSDDKRYYYAYDARVLGEGTVIFSESTIVYSGLTT